MKAQRDLFAQHTALSAEPPSLFAEIVFNRPLEQSFTYGVPRHLEDRLQPGQRVQVPLGRGNRPALGYCVAVSRNRPECEVKPILAIVDEKPLLTPALLELTRWMADYYFCTWGQVLDAVVPAGAKTGVGLRQKLFVEAVPETELPIPPPRLTPRQREALETLRLETSPVEAAVLAQRVGCGVTVIQELIRKGMARGFRQDVEKVRFRPEPTPEAEPPPELNTDQLRVLAAISEALLQGGFQPFLLHGVTGSGKTEIYLRAIEQCVAQGREALVLVPEISLTPQTIRRFRGRFSRVAVLHSHLSDSERGHYWRQIAAGEVQVIVGARSAVFAPTRRLGLIVVDEEHESSFKQEITPRYHARDLAVLRAKIEKIPVVLGSATPSLESWHNAQQGRYRLLSLPRRVLELPMPIVQLVDLRHEPPARGPYRAISPTLERAMRETLDRGGQILLLLNRRGFSTFLLCPACGEAMKCRFCDVTLTYHRDREVLLCHYCGYEQLPPDGCPHCGLRQMKFLGLGTERLEAELSQKFPGVSALRMDSDSMRRAGAHARAFEAFRRGEVRILFGTQMIAKGLDFPNVTLVGVIHADIALHIPDFRSAERTFQLLAQVAGRTGRGPAGGRVLVQTFNPEQPCIHLAARHDYVAFAEAELRHRRELGYPPFTRLVRILLRAKDGELVRQESDRLAETFRQRLARTAKRKPTVRLLGPAETPVARLKGYYRYHFQLQSPSASALHELLREVWSDFKPSRGVDVSVDVDPYNLL
ncbi:MAG: primosomal protein N' [Gemmatales bacterium]|nr:primosomal protein N' [Gemmatales bacterium]MDW8387200.1 primosomal protein N' [Gemmatales bacterium]